MVVSKTLLHKIKKYDAYAKIIDDVRIRTTTGAAVSVISGLIITLLILYEISRYMTIELEPQIIVDGGKMEKMPIYFDITFPSLPCFRLSLDVMDESGVRSSDYTHDVFKVRINKEGWEIDIEKQQDLSSPLNKTEKDTIDENYCGPCYGAPAPEGSSCCNTCDEVRHAYAQANWVADPSTFEQCQRAGWKPEYGDQDSEGCRMHGHLLANKVRGNIHFSSGHTISDGNVHTHDVGSFLASHNNFVHHIKHFRFGSQDYQTMTKKRTKSVAMSNPLDGVHWGTEDAWMMYQYFLNVVPTQFEYLSGKSLRTFQYSVSRHERNLRRQFSDGLPGVFFHLDFSAMRVIYSETHISLTSFLTSVCAVVGGVFAVAGIIDGMLFRAERAFQKKLALGKVQ